MGHGVAIAVQGPDSLQASYSYRGQVMLDRCDSKAKSMLVVHPGFALRRSAPAQDTMKTTFVLIALVLAAGAASAQGKPGADLFDKLITLAK